MKENKSKKESEMKKILMLLSVILLAACSAPVEISPTSYPTYTPLPTYTSIPTETNTPEPTATKTPKPTSTPRAVRPYDFVIELVVIEKSCFGSAGCLVTVEPDLYFTTDFPEGKHLIVIYEIRGGEEIEIENLEVFEDGMYEFYPSMISTASSEDELRAVVTDVRQR